MLLALGAWPGCRSVTRSTVGPIRFVVTNDCHHEEAACDPWMNALFDQVAQTQDASFLFCLGDLANSGKRESLESIATAARRAGMPMYPTPGNHDLDLSPVDGFYEAVFPGRRNYTFTENGWQFVVVDTTEGVKWKDVTIADDTLAWLDATMPTLDPSAPTVLATHFPVAADVRMCPLNAEKLLAKFVGYNLRGSFSGHFHGQTSVAHGDAELVTNVCVARVRGNHDGTDFKGYWVCDGEADGTLRRTFVPFAGV
ncbi:MAG: hypothetical protein SynsKO_03600 [Synoicihabitans sp.]